MLYIPRHTVRRATACNSNKVRPGSSLPTPRAFCRVDNRFRRTPERPISGTFGIHGFLRWLVFPEHVAGAAGAREPREHDDHHHSQLDEGGSQESLQGVSQQSLCEKSLTSTEGPVDPLRPALNPPPRLISIPFPHSRTKFSNHSLISITTRTSIWGILRVPWLFGCHRARGTGLGRRVRRVATAHGCVRAATLTTEITRLWAWLDLESKKPVWEVEIPVVQSPPGRRRGEALLKARGVSCGARARATSGSMCPMRVWLLFFSGIVAGYLAWTSSLFGGKRPELDDVGDVGGPPPESSRTDATHEGDGDSGCDSPSTD